MLTQKQLKDLTDFLAENYGIAGESLEEFKAKIKVGTKLKILDIKGFQDITGSTDITQQFAEVEEVDPWDPRAEARLKDALNYDWLSYESLHVAAQAGMCEITEDALTFCVGDSFDVKDLKALNDACVEAWTARFSKSSVSIFEVDDDSMPYRLAEGYETSQGYWFRHEQLEGLVRSGVLCRTTEDLIPKHIEDTEATEDTKEVFAAGTRVRVYTHNGIGIMSAYGSPLTAGVKTVLRVVRESFDKTPHVTFDGSLYYSMARLNKALELGNIEILDPDDGTLDGKTATIDGREYKLTLA